MVQMLLLSIDILKLRPGQKTCESPLVDIPWFVMDGQGMCVGVKCEHPLD